MSFRGIIGLGGASAAALAWLSISQLPTGPRPAPPAPPELWLSETLDQQGDVRGATQVCVDSKLRDGLTRALPRINGEPCLMMGQPVEKPSRWAARCVAFGRRYGVVVHRRGDEEGRLNVDMRLTPLGTDYGSVRQVMRFRRLGSCPAGWKIGDSGSLGGRPRRNALSL